MSARDRTGRRALVVVDVQRDFCPGGSLAVAGGDEVAARVARYLDGHAADYHAVVTTRDWHVSPVGHFAPAGTEPDFRTTWPPHCVAGTPGAEYHPALAPALERTPSSEFRKGRTSAAYSGFEGTLVGDDGVGLGQWLDAQGIDAVDVVGLATDHCVRATALDARARGLDVRVLTDLCAGVDPTTSAQAWEELSGAGVVLAASEEAPERPAPGVKASE